MYPKLGRVGCVALIGLTGALVGCGSDEATSDTSAGTTAGTTATTATTAAETTPASTTSVESTVLPSVDDLRAMLLAAGDVGAAWQLGPAITDADLADATQIPCPDSAINPTIAARLTPLTGVQFEPADRSSKHVIEFAVTGRPEQLDADLQVLYDAIDACAATTPTSVGSGSVTVERLTIPELGDQRAAFTSIGVQSPDATWYVRDAEVRVGAVAVHIGLTEIVRSPDDDPAISDAEFVAIVEQATAKLPSPPAGLANPASVYCVEQGGRVDIVDEAGGQVGYCELPDGRRIEEWDFYRAQATTTAP